MKTDLETDIFISKDDSQDYKESQKYIINRDFDNETKIYYNRIIRIKNILETAFNHIEKLLFTEYFEGITLREVSDYYDIKKICKGYDLLEKPFDYRFTLADACFKFIYLIDLYPEISIKDFIDKLKQKNPSVYDKLFLYFIDIDTYKTSIYKIIDSKKAYLYGRIYFLYNEYEEFCRRTNKRKEKLFSID